MKKSILLISLMACISLFLQAGDATSPRKYLKKENYEIIEITLPDELRRGEASINESGLVVVFDNEAYGVEAMYFDPTRRKLIRHKQLSEVCCTTDINNNGQICGYGCTFGSSPCNGFIWSIVEDKVEWFGGVRFSRIFNDGSCLTNNGFRMDPEGNIKPSRGRYYSIANKDGQYPSDEAILKISLEVGIVNHLYPIAYNSKGQLLFSIEDRNNISNTWFVADTKGVHQLKNPLGIGFAIRALPLNDSGVVAGCLHPTKPDQNQPDETKACLWHEQDIYFLSDVFEGNYGDVIAINNRGDMVVRGQLVTNQQGRVVPQMFLFLKKNHPKSPQASSQKSGSAVKNVKNSSRTASERKRVAVKKPKPISCTE